MEISNDFARGKERVDTILFPVIAFTDLVWFGTVECASRVAHQRQTPFSD